MPYWRLFYHITWGTKDRAPLIEAAFENSLYNVLTAKAQELGALVYAVGGIEEHVHVVASVPPSIRLADVVGQMKGASSHWVNHEGWAHGRFAWQAEYGIVSFGGRQLTTVVQYARHQRQHHQDRSLFRLLEQVQPDPVP